MAVQCCNTSTGCAASMRYKCCGKATWPWKILQSTADLVHYALSIEYCAWRPENPHPVIAKINKPLIVIFEIQSYIQKDQSVVESLTNINCTGIYFKWGMHLTEVNNCNAFKINMLHDADHLCAYFSFHVYFKHVM